jgi:Mlc titration factor MtfA (ptsG expression regulator)
VISAIIALLLLYKTLFTLTETAYGILFHKPFYIHFYFKIKKLSVNQLEYIKNQFPFYNSLSTKHQNYFEHRVAHFIEKYDFIGKENFEITDEVKVLIAATSTMLTFGMRNYLYNNIDRVIVFPCTYLSTVTGEYHKGEYNPRVRSIVFSWEDFKAGFSIPNDNLNLGIHEFSHVLHFHGLKSEDASALIFARMYSKIQKEINHPPNLDRLINSNYFRIYAYTNQFEFLSVIIEHYFETPVQFKNEFPELFRNVSKMLNHSHLNLIY